MARLPCGSKNTEHWTPNNFFKQKYGIKMIEKIAFPKARHAIGVLADLLGSAIS